ncbi:MAG: hypothetical protein EON54_28910, partial [Alcaligenaceae bacterium]
MFFPRWLVVRSGWALSLDFIVAYRLVQGNGFNPSRNVFLHPTACSIQYPQPMYLIVIVWTYVTLMMAVAEATSPVGTVLGAIVTFVLYGLLPMSILVYI